MSRSTARGFTLAEVLVVLLVIGLAAGFAYARFDSDPRHDVEREARRFATALEHAAALAQWRSQTLGVSAGGAGYRFWRRTTSSEGDQWLALNDDEILAPRALPQPLVAIARQYAGRSVAADAILPLAASGRNEPYAIEIASPEWRVLLIADPLNRVSVSEPLAP
jgi:type II secretion system protein H